MDLAASGPVHPGLPYGRDRLQAIRMERFCVGWTAMIGARAFRALVLTAALSACLTPVTCPAENAKPLPAKATKELPPELLSLLRQKKMPKTSPIILRV